MSPSKPKSLRVVGMDPSLRNWGIAVGIYSPETGRIQINRLGLTNPILPAGKQVRQNSADLASAHQLFEGAVNAARNADAVFVEVPVGSQSARAMASYGICVGVLGALRATGTPFFEVTPTEVKLAGFGKKTATKQQMIDWATKAHPEAGWPIYRRNGVELISESQAEHQADAVAAIHAGIASQPFQQLLPMMAALSKESPECRSN